MRWPERYYNGIDDIPLYNWIKINEGKIEYCRKELEVGKTEDDYRAYIKIMDGYIKEFGLLKLQKRIFQVMKKKAIHELNFVLTGERFELTLAEMELAKLNMMLSNNGSETTIEQVLVHISKWMGTWINAKTITAREYFNLVKEFERSNKK